MIRNFYGGALSKMLLFTLCFGYPKIPGLSVPMGIIALILDYRRISSLIQCREIRALVFVSSTFLFFGFGRLMFADTSVDLVKEMVFLLSQQYKIFIGIYCGCLVYLIITRHPNQIYAYILLQVSLMVLSSFSESLYRHLLLYQTEDSTNVFGAIFGKRSIGFGLIHNEGVANLVALYMITVSVHRADRFLSILLDLAIYGSVLMSRMGVLLILCGQLIQKRFVATMCFSLVFIYVYLVGVREDTILSETFEAVINYQQTGEISTRSSTDMIGMRWLPNSEMEFLIGNGRFFGINGFHNDTDIGFARLMFFGGIPYIILYFVVNYWGVMSGWKWLNRGWLNLFCFSVVFIFANVKSIIVLNWVTVFLSIYYTKPLSLKAAVEVD
jgi:hypothetical protein